jgi:quercetin dioxygenase-like cupin family protein
MDREGDDRGATDELHVELGGRHHRGWSLASLEKRAKSQGFDGYNRLTFARLHHGGAPVTKDQLEELGTIYGVQRWLFSDFLFPAFRYAVGVDVRTDMRRVTDRNLGELDYWVPSRHLAYSDVTIARVELAPGAESPKNRHPGFELLKPLEGKVMVRHRGTPSPVVGKDEYVYFRSRVAHQVVNPGTERASVLVLRFLE